MLGNNMEGNGFEELFEQTLGNIKNMLSMQTVVGEAVDMGQGCMAYPIIKITVGTVCGGGEYSAKKLTKHAMRFPFLGGSGAGFSAEPVGFLINNNGDIKFFTVESKNMTSEVIKKLADAFSKYVDNLSKNKKDEEF